MNSLVDWEPDCNYETTKCNKTPEERSRIFTEQVKHLTVGDAIKLNNKIKEVKCAQEHYLED